jgi:hypothetical protein
MQTYTEAQATDETMLLLTRKLRRLHPEAFKDVWDRLPEGAQRAVYQAEARADVVRDTKPGLTWEPEEDLDGE